MNLPGPIVEADWLAEHLCNVVVADVRWSIEAGPQEQDYFGGHIPGAVFVNLDTDLAATAGASGRHPLPSPSDFAETRSRLGFDGIKPIVAYDDRSGAVAARLWWMLDALEVPVAVLNGGIDAWNGALAKGNELPEPTSVGRQNWPLNRFVEADEIKGLLANGATLLDARSLERFQGRPNPIDSRPGRIPGARSRPWTDNVAADGRFIERSVLRSDLEQLGAGSSDELLVSCGSGVTACHDLLACRIAGFDNGRLYTGSWSEWGADEARDIATDQS